MLDAKSRTWSRLLAKLISFPLDRMPPLAASDSVAGELTSEAAAQMGLRPGIPVAMGMADIPAAAVGSGAVRAGEAHVYLGTSAWIGVTVAKPKNVPKAGIASVPAVGHDTCLMIGESETAGACRAWFEQNIGAGPREESLDALASRAEPGSRGLLFLPWLFGERSPVPDTRVRGGFVNLSLDHGREHLIRALYEGIALNLRWILDGCAEAGERCPSMRAIGGGATSDCWLSILADVTGRAVERVEHPLQAGAVGSALVAAIAAGDLANVDAIRRLVRVERRFEPNPGSAAVYSDAYEVFRELHPALSRAARIVRSNE
jgi:xylulokinase